VLTDPSTIDRIVAGVLTQIGGGAPGVGQVVTTETRRHGGGGVESGESRVKSGATSSTNGESRSIELRVRLVTAETLERLDGTVRELVINPKTIVTPAAWDVIKERGLNVQRTVASQPVSTVSPSTINPQPSTPSLLLIIVHHTDAVARVWDDLQGAWRREFLGCPDDAAKLAIAELARGGVKQVVILAEQTYRAACLANRHESVKAAAIHEVSDIATVRQQIRANVWCISPRNKSWFDLRRLFKSLVSGP
jgi:hypothetical protein